MRCKPGYPALGAMTGRTEKRRQDCRYDNGISQTTTHMLAPPRAPIFKLADLSKVPPRVEAVVDRNIAGERVED
jgi:hypothetical protein